MWQVIYIAPSKQVAEELRDALTQEGLLVKLRAIGLSSDAPSQVELLVPKGEAQEAHEILTQVLGRTRAKR